MNLDGARMVIWPTLFESPGHVTHNGTAGLSTYSAPTRYDPFYIIKILVNLLYPTYMIYDIYIYYYIFILINIHSINNNSSIS